MLQISRCTTIAVWAGLALCLSLLTASAQAETSFRLLDETIQGPYSLVCPLPTDGRELRVAFDATGPEDLSYIGLSGSKVALYRVTDGHAKRLAEAGRPPTAEPAELTLQRRPGRARVIVSGRLRLDVPWEAPPGGQVGVAEESGIAPDELLLQGVEDPVFSDDFTREAGEMEAWTSVGGTFRNTMVQAPGADPARSANPFSLHITAEPEATATTGAWFWDAYRVSASVKPLTASAVGICAYVLDDRNYLALRWDAGDERASGARRLVLVRDGVEQVLAGGPGGFAPGEWYRLELVVSPGEVEALIDRDPVLKARTNAFAQGGIGLWVQQGTAVFDDALVKALGDSAVEPPRINPVFVEDQIMAAQQLYLPRGLWGATGAQGDTWHWGRFYGEAVVTIPLSQLAGKELGVALQPVGSAEPPDNRLSLSMNGDRLALHAERVGQPQLAGEAIVQGDAPVTVELRGDLVAACQAGRDLVTYELPAAPLGREVALLDAGSGATDEITVTAPHHFEDYTFASGPTDWFGGKGTWDVTSRWHCEPGWTFLGGTDDQNPVIWTKHAYAGDVVFEFYGAIRMEENLVGTPYAYIHPSDINVTLCGDGETLGTGYSFVLAGWNNTKTAILRNGEVVAETKEVVLQDTTTRGAFHRHWFRVRAEKLGDTVRYWVDDKPVLEYQDPEPLAGGRIGLWTFHNDLMVARARVWYAHEEQPGGVVRSPVIQPSDLVPTTREPGATELYDDFESGSGEWVAAEDAPGAVLELDNRTAASGKQSLRITNGAEGGPLTVYPVTSPFKASEWPVLSFDYRLPPEVKLNLYLYTNETWHVVQLTAPGPERDDVVVLGAADMQADGKWHHAEISLRDLLQAKYPQFKVFQVKRLVFCPPWDSYVRCGIGGNPRGAQFWIDNFRLGPGGAGMAP